ncbi:MAG: Glyoxal reductase [Candidatus Taylorbacteria bacterium]|nr:Glyoxal reductase [Candidatus Taylorbacteria bacterium]
MHKKLTLNNGIQIPAIGLGVYKSQEGAEVENAVKWALEAGYRLIDTAQIYGNEEGVGRAIKESGVPRNEIFITTKLWNTDQGYESALKAFDGSLTRLGLDHVDLYLIHWPSASEDRLITIDKRKETWKAMEEIYASGKAKAIGVSNYTVKHLEEMKGYAKVPPAVNQVEFHPFLHQKELLEYCKQNGIILEAYSPLVKARKLDDPRIAEIAQKHQKTNAQVLIRWSIQHGCLPIPKSVHRDRIIENIDVFDFELAPEDMAALDGLHENVHQAWNPEAII